MNSFERLGPGVHKLSKNPYFHSHSRTVGFRRLLIVQQSGVRPRSTQAQAHSLSLLLDPVDPISVRVIGRAHVLVVG